MGTSLVIDNAVINWLTKEEAVVKQFEFLRKKTVVSSGCCQNKSGSSIPDYMYIKQAIANLPENELNKLKEILKVEKLEIYTSLYGKPIIK